MPNRQKIFQNPTISSNVLCYAFIRSQYSLKTARISIPYTICVAGYSMFVRIYAIPRTTWNGPNFFLPIDWALSSQPSWACLSVSHFEVAHIPYHLFSCAWDILLGFTTQTCFGSRETFLKLHRFDGRFSSKLLFWKSHYMKNFW